MLIQSDAFNLPYKSKTFHACVTSPPYWGLRKYTGDQGEEPLGLEATPDRHIERMVEVFREVRRVLRDDGVVWLNYGDCYATSPPGNKPGTLHIPSGLPNSAENMEMRRSQYATNKDWGYKQGSLMLMPHRLAIALQADGWIVRNDLVWFKRNPMPESVAGWRWERHRIKTKRSKHATKHNIKGGTEAMLRDASIHQGISEDWLPDYIDCPGCEKCEKNDGLVLRKSIWRHTRAHEYVFQLTKSMGYYCNQEVVRETSITGDGAEQGIADGKRFGGNANAQGPVSGFGERILRNHPSGRNPRSVLDVPTAPYKGAHYATFPPKLIAPLIRASVPRRCCPECGMAWAPVVERGDPKQHPDVWSNKSPHQFNSESNSYIESHTLKSVREINVTDYRPTCECGVTEHEPGIVLDIFGGSGTTGMVAKQLMRRWVVMDISRPYLDEQAKVRTGSGTPSKALEGLPMFGGEDETEWV